MRFVVKISTNLLTKEDHSLNVPFIQQIVAQLTQLHAAGHEPIIVTSGAVTAGRQALTLKKENKHIPYRQVLASIGQTLLLETYRDQFSTQDILTGQVLLTRADFEDRDHFLSTRNTLELMLQLRVVPIINENDVTTFDELKFGDNDNLSARVASLINAEKLILLSDVDGLYDGNPKNNPEAHLIPVVEKINDTILGLAEDTKSKTTVGGMAGKLAAAKYATEAGVTVWIAKGTTPNVVVDILTESAHHGTRFERQFSPREARRKWLQTQCLSTAWIQVDAGATRALLEGGKSLLPSGVVQVEGAFLRGDVIKIQGQNGETIGFGQINYGTEEMIKICGVQSNEIAGILGYALEDVVIHRDNMVV